MSMKLSILLSVFFTSCYCTIIPSQGQCRAIPVRQRVQCAETRYGRNRCVREGCCFDRSVKDAIWCFKSNERADELLKDEHVNLKSAFFPVTLTTQNERSEMRSCTAPPRDRVDCGWSSISQKICQARGCCWDPSEPVGPRCFQPESFLVPKKARQILECTWECSRQPWRKIARGYSRCSTNAFCWMETVSQSSGLCITACKTDQALSTFLTNVSQCLGLDIRTAWIAKRDCDTDLPCWIDRYGLRSLTCFRRYQTSTWSRPTAFPASVTEQQPRGPLRPAISPESQETSPEILNREGPVEPGHVPQSQTPIFLRDILRTDILVEQSQGQTEDRREVEEEK